MQIKSTDATRRTDWLEPSDASKCRLAGQRTYLPGDQFVPDFFMLYPRDMSKKNRLCNTVLVPLPRSDKPETQRFPATMQVMTGYRESVWSSLFFGSSSDEMPDNEAMHVMRLPNVWRRSIWKELNRLSNASGRILQ